MSKNKLNSKKKKSLALIALFAISAIMFLNSQVKDAKAIKIYHDIPINPKIDPYNNWFWDKEINNGTEFIYETKFLAVNKSTNDIVWGGMFNFIFNITLFNATIQWHDKPCFFSVINATELYYNESLGKTVAYPMNPKIVGGFQYNISEYPQESKERIATTEMVPIPFFLPINGSYGETIDDDIEDLANIINESIFYPYYEYGRENYGFSFMNLWNDIDTSGNEIQFTNESGYYCNLEYYSNGTLKNAEMYMEILGDDPANGPESIVIFNATFNRIFDPNPINEVQWGVEVGDVIYYGANEGDGVNSCSYDEIYWNITSIVNETLKVEGMLSSFLYEGDGYCTFQEVIADKYVWDRAMGIYDLDHKEVIIGKANEYLPYIQPIFDQASWIIPNNTREQDLQFFTMAFFNRWSMDEFSGEYCLDFKTENDLYKSDATLGSNDASVLCWIDKNNGIIQRFEYNDYNDGEWVKIFIKENYTLSTSNSFDLNTRMLANNINATVNVTTNGGSSAFVVALLPKSPVNETLPYGTPIVFVDWLITKISALTNINITIKLPASLDLDALNIQLWVWNETNHPYDWYIPDDMSDIIIFNYGENSVTFKMPLSDPNAREFIKDFAFAISYTARISPSLPSGDDDDDDGDEEPSAISGFDLWVLFGVIGLISLIAVLKKRKFVK